MAKSKVLVKVKGPGTLTRVKRVGLSDRLYWSNTRARRVVRRARKAQQAHMGQP